MQLLVKSFYKKNPDEAKLDELDTDVNDFIVANEVKVVISIADSFGEINSTTSIIRSMVYCI